MNKIIDTMIHAAREAGQIISRNYGQSLNIQEKGPGNIVTETDREAEDKIIGILGKEFDFSIYSEESGKSGHHKEYTWIIDPLDGTSNFAKQIPFFCTSIGLFRNDRPEAGVIYQPVTDELFHAMAGEGAFLNGKRLRAREPDPPVIVNCTHGYGLEAGRKHLEALQGIMPLSDNNRLFGASALELAYLAAGRLDVYLTYGDELYDVAAGILLATEAGYRISNWKGEKWETDMPDLLAVNPTLEKEFLAKIKG